MTTSIYDLLNPANQDTAATVNNTDTFTLDQAGTLVQGSITQLVTMVTNTLFPSTGSGAPLSTPAVPGLFYVDTTNRKVYCSTGNSSSSDWTILN